VRLLPGTVRSSFERQVFLRNHRKSTFNDLAPNSIDYDLITVGEMSDTSPEMAMRYINPDDPQLQMVRLFSLVVAQILAWH
jgi:hypothetical protein